MRCFLWIETRILIMWGRHGFETEGQGGLGKPGAGGSGPFGLNFRPPGAVVPSQRGRAQAGDAERTGVSRVA